MKKQFLILFLMVSYMLQAQDLPTEPANGFSFPLGTKFTIKLVPVDSVNYDYSVIAFEPFDKTVDTHNTNDLFEKEGQSNTIVFYFCLGTHGDTEAEKKQNMKVLLVMKNYSDTALKYISEIQREENGEYLPTSNVNTYPGVKTTEMWPYMIYMIGLREFQKLKF